MRIVLLVLLLNFLVGQTVAENWPRFRGVNGSGIAEDSNIPAQWSKNDYTWTANLPGSGDSSPVVWEGTVYVTCADEESNIFTILALKAADGEVIWRRDFPFEPLSIHSLNSHATSTPTVDSSGIFALLFTETNSFVFALDHTGKELWTRDLGPSATLHGPALSPILHKGSLIVSFEQEVNDRDLEGRWYALDLRTGKTLWHVSRDSDIKASSSTPCVYRSSNGTDWYIFSSNEHGVSAVNAANGKIDWENENAMPTRAVGSPIVSDGLIVANCGAGGSLSTLIALRPGEDSEESARTIYTVEEKFVPYMTTPIAVEELLFTFGDRGRITCFDKHSGAIIWSERFKGRIFGSPVLVEDRLYCITSKGVVLVIKASESFEQLALNNLGEESKASPAVADGRMFLRTKTRLSCVAAPGI